MRPRQPPWPAIIARVRASLGGVVSTLELKSLGARDHHLTQWVKDGDLIRLVRGWYALPERQTSVISDAHFGQVYLRTLEPDRPALLTGPSGLWAWGADVTEPASPVFAVDHGRRVRQPAAPWTTVQRTDLPAHATYVKQGLATNSPGRMLADAAALDIDDDALARLLLGVRTCLRSHPRTLVDELHRLDQPGVGRVLDLVRSGFLEHDSPAEHRLFADCFATFPPAPDCQVYITPDRRADYAYVFAALIIEYYGEQWHDGTVDADSTRTFEFREMGYDVLAITKTVRRRRARVMRHVHEVRRMRERLMLAGELRRPPLPPQPGRLHPLRTLVPLG